MVAGDVKLALVGYGKIAPKHLDVFRALGASFVASANRSEAGRARAKSEGGIAKTYASIGELLEKERVDGIVCCASFPQIYGAALELIPAKVPVLLEKPPGTSLGELETLIARARSTETPVMIGMNRRHYSVLTRAVEDAGGKEAVTSVLVEWSEDPSHMLARFNKEEVSRVVFANSLHGLDLLTTLAGRFSLPAVNAVELGEPFRWTMSLTGISDRRVHGTFWSTWDAPGKWRLSFAARGRRYVFAPLESCTVTVQGQGDKVIEPSDEDKRFKPGFYGQARAFLDVIATNRVPAELDLSSSLPAMALAQRLTDAALQSGRSRS